MKRLIDYLNEVHQTLLTQATPSGYAHCLSSLDEGLEQATSYNETGYIADFAKLGGQIAEEIGDYDRALAYYALYSEYVGVNPWTNYHMGNIYLKQGETEKAYEQYKACYQLSLTTKGYKTVVPPFLKRKLKEHGLKLKDLGL